MYLDMSVFYMNEELEKKNTFTCGLAKHQKFTPFDGMRLYSIQI